MSGRLRILTVAILVSAISTIALADNAKRPSRRSSARSIDLGHVTVERFAEQIGPEPEDLYRFVRDHVRFEPYHGALRGPRGTLLALAGNSLDQSLLLKELLSKAGYETRIVRSKLSKERARQLARSLFPWKSPVKVSPSSAQSRWLTDTKRQHIARTAQQIYPALTASASSSTDSPLDQVANEARDHFWVQCWADRQWVDLDPTLANTRFGVASAAASEVVTAPQKAFAHRVHLRIRIAETVDAQQTTRTLYEWKGTSAQLAGQAFVIEHVPVRTARGLAGALATVGTSESASVQPLITLAGKTERGEVFRMGQAADNARGQLPPGFGRFGFGNSAPNQGKRVAVREWIEIETFSPCGRKDHTARTLHDPSELTRPDIVRTQVTVLSVICCAANRFHYPKTFRALSPPADGDHEVWRLLRAINLLLVSEPGNIARSFAIPNKGFVRYVVDKPQVVVSDFRISDGKARIYGDLRFVSQRVVADFALSRRGRAMYRVLRGIIDTQYESDLFAAIFRDGFALSSEPSAMRILGQVDSLHRLSVEDVQRLPIKPHVRTTACEQIACGSVLLGSKRPIPWSGRQRAAWWLVNRQTGATIGVTDNGLHSTATGTTGTTGTQSQQNTRAVRTWYVPAVAEGTRQASIGVARLLAMGMMIGIVATTPGNSQEQDADDQDAHETETEEGESEDEENEEDQDDQDDAAEDGTADNDIEAPQPEPEPPVVPGSVPGESPEVSDTARDIANGHAYDKHVDQNEEFPEIDSPDEFAELIDGIINNPSEDQAISNDRHKYWDDETGTIVITNPNDPDGGTCFRPIDGKTYYDNVN